jgi:hypothetical protein
MNCHESVSYIVLAALHITIPHYVLLCQLSCSCVHLLMRDFFLHSNPTLVWNINNNYVFVSNIPFEIQ